MLSALERSVVNVAQDGTRGAGPRSGRRPTPRSPRWLARAVPWRFGPRGRWLWCAVVLGLVSCAGPEGATTDAQHPAGSDVAAGDAVSGDETSDPDGGTTGPRLTHLPLGTHATGEDGLSGPIAFDLPAGVTAMVLRVEGDSAYSYTLAGLERDAGFALVPKAWLSLSPSPQSCVSPCANRIVAQPGAAAFLFPNTPLVDLRPGPHRVRVYAFDADKAPVKTEVNVAVDLVRPAPPPVAWQLPVNLCLTGAMGWTAANVLQQPRAQQALATARSLLAQAGITIAPLRVFDVAESGSYIATQHGPSSDLAKLFKSGAGLPNGVNVFLTERVIAVGGLPGANVVLGLSGGIPGVPNAVGHMRGGVAVSLALPAGKPDVLGQALAHEIGHFLGLFHTSEAKGSGGQGAHDTLPDTPHDDPTNLMYWSVTPQAKTLSHEQVQVLRRSPWLVAVTP